MISDNTKNFIIDVVTWGILTTNLCYFFLLYTELPDSIIVHYDILGNPNNIGNKQNILIIQLINVGICIVLSILAKKPSLYNYPVPVTDENRNHLYLQGIKLVKHLRLLFVIIFSGISFYILQNKPIDIWFMIFILLSPFILLIYFTHKMKSILKGK